MNEYLLIEEGRPHNFVTTICFGDLFDVVVCALERWRYGKTEDERIHCKQFYVTKSFSDEDIRNSVDIKQLSTRLLHAETVFALNSKSDDHFDEEKFIRSFIEGGLYV